MKKKQSLLFAFLFLACAIYAADTTAVKKPFKRLYVAASFTPMVSYRLLTDNARYEGMVNFNEMASWRNKYEKPAFGYAVGGRFGVNATPFLSVETGLDYSQLRYKSSDIYQDIVRNYRLISVPFALNFMFGKGKLKALIVPGINFSFLFAHTATYRFNSNGNYITRVDKPSASSMDVFPFLGIGIHWNVTRAFFLRLIPMAQIKARKSLSSFCDQRLWSAGVNLALGIGFVKVK
jgi:hypothetical protein